MFVLNLWGRNVGEAILRTLSVLCLSSGGRASQFERRQHWAQRVSCARAVWEMRKRRCGNVNENMRELFYLQHEDKWKHAAGGTESRAGSLQCRARAQVTQLDFVKKTETDCDVIELLCSVVYYLLSCCVNIQINISEV